jgi:hypothetical protein
VHDGYESSKLGLDADPWVRRPDQPSPIDFILKQGHKQQRQKSIQYETRLYYYSPSSPSDEQLTQQQEHQRQPLLSNVDKDIEYVESRLRGQTTDSLPPASHPAHYSRDGTWLRLPHKNHANVLSPSSNDQQQLTTSVHQTYLDVASTSQNNDTAACATKAITQKPSTTLSTSTNGSVKTVKSRIEKVKDQKAAKTLR